MAMLRHLLVQKKIKKKFVWDQTQLHKTACVVFYNEEDFNLNILNI